MADAVALVQKLSNHNNVLRDDGMSYGDDIEQTIDLAAAQDSGSAFVLAEVTGK